ncbi:MAG: translation initiation factor IF-2 [bacterium]|nr:translation initiation factor IF-2 [bacterium]
MLRQPLVVVMGNVDHGKTKILDCIRRTAIVESEPGAITQMISSSAVSLKTIQKICGDLLKNKNITIPGIVFIDTPGHAAFSNMRKRGSNLADIAILVININEGIKPQTEECIALLKKYKTPFVIALNKIDLIQSWRPAQSPFVLDIISKQSPQVQTAIETKLYEIVGKCYDLGFQADRFDRIDDYTKTIAMIPCSAKSGDGIPELLMVLIGLAQKFLEQNLHTDQNAPGKATVLEVKEEQGLGITLDAIIYEGKIQVGDSIIIGGLYEPIVTKIKSLFLSDEKGKYIAIKEVHAAAGVKITAVGIKEVVSGMPLFVIDKNESELREKIQEEVDEVVIETEENGILVKADTLGSLEALISMLKEKNIPIKKASVGNVTKKDIAAATSSEDPYERVILCFNVNGVGEGVKIISHNVIYQLIDDFEAWIAAEKKKEEQKELLGLIRPAKIKYLRGCTFRQNNPCVIGVEVLQGTLRPDTDLIKENGDVLAHIKTVEYERESVAEAERGKQVAISLPGVTAGRQIHEEEIYYVDITEETFRKLKEFKKLLTPEEITVLKELAEIKRKANNFWGV